MLIHCKYCQSKFAINAEEVGFDGRLVKCENCQKEWFQESKSKSLEKKTNDLQIKIQSDNASDKLDNLEKDFVSNEETKVSNEETKENKDNTTLPEEDSYSSNIRNISPKDWDLSEETLERELNTIKKNKL